MTMRTVLCAEDGMVLTDGANYGTVVYLAEGVSADTYRAITQEEYEAVREEQAAQGEDGPEVME